MTGSVQVWSDMKLIEISSDSKCLWQVPWFKTRFKYQLILSCCWLLVLLRWFLKICCAWSCKLKENDTFRFVLYNLIFKYKLHMELNAAGRNCKYGGRHYLKFLLPMEEVQVHFLSPGSKVLVHSDIFQHVWEFPLSSDNLRGKLLNFWWKNVLALN